MKEIWLVGGRESRTINRLKKKLRSLWGLEVVSHWDISKVKFPHSGKPAFALVLTDWSNHVQMDWLSKERPELRVVMGTRKWAELTTMLESQGITPEADIGDVKEDKVYGLRAAAELLGTSFSAVNRRIKATQGQPNSPVRENHEGNDTWMWRTRGECLHWWIYSVANAPPQPMIEEEEDTTTEEEIEEMLDSATKPVVTDLPLPQPAGKHTWEVILEIDDEANALVDRALASLNRPVNVFMYGETTREKLLQKALLRGLQILEEDLR